MKTVLKQICPALLICLMLLSGCTAVSGKQDVPAVASKETAKDMALQENGSLPSAGGIPTAESYASGTETIFLAGGCFWGGQKFLDQFDGVLQTETGYANGPDSPPTYQEVCSGSGHAETVRVVYDPGMITLTELLNAYFMVIDPLSVNRQGNGAYSTAPASITPTRTSFPKSTRSGRNRKRMRGQNWLWNWNLSPISFRRKYTIRNIWTITLEGTVIFPVTCSASRNRKKFRSPDWT